MGGIRYGSPYTSRLHTSASHSCVPSLDLFFGSRAPDFNRINAAQGSSMALDQRSEQLWGSRRYGDPAALVLEEDGLIGLLKAQSNSGKETVAETIDAFLALRGLDQLVIHADETGYVALLSHHKTTLHIRYFSDDDSAVIHRYGSCSSKPAQHRKRELMRTAPRSNEEGWRDGSLTEDIGVLVYDHGPLLCPEGVKVSARKDRKKPCTYSPGKFMDGSSTRTVAEYLRSELPYAFATSFPSSAEKEKIREGDAVTFTIRFKGCRVVGQQDSARDQELKTAYDHGLRSALHAVLGNIYASIAPQKQYVSSFEQVLLEAK